jgi:hypothetical protein
MEREFQNAICKSCEFCTDEEEKRMTNQPNNERHETVADHLAGMVAREMQRDRAEAEKLKGAR